MDENNRNIHKNMIMFLKADNYRHTLLAQKCKFFVYKAYDFWLFSRYFLKSTFVDRYEEGREKSDEENTNLYNYVIAYRFFCVFIL